MRRANGYQKTEATGPKPMRVITVSVNLGAITAPEHMPSRRVVGARMMQVGNGSEMALGFMMRSWSGGQSGRP